MQKKIQELLARLGKAILAEVLTPLEEIKTEQRELSTRFDKLEQKVDKLEGKVTGLEKKIEQLHEIDPIITECDLASLDNQICTRIAKCRERQYTTAEDRRIVGRMHEAYKSRGGNHGEDQEYEIFCRLPTEEAYWHSIGGAN